MELSLKHPTACQIYHIDLCPKVPYRIRLIVRCQFVKRARCGAVELRSSACQQVPLVVISSPESVKTLPRIDISVHDALSG